MKISHKILGKDARIFSDGSTMNVFTRIMSIYCTTDSTLTGKSGVGKPGEWARVLSGIDQITPFDNFNIAPTMLNPTKLTGDLKLMSAFLKQAKTIVDIGNSPRHYGQVVAIKDNALVATDGFRLMYTDNAITGATADIMIPAIVIAPLAKLLEQADYMAVSECGTTIEIRGLDFSAFVRLATVKYPAYRGVLPISRELVKIEEIADIAPIIAQATLVKKATKLPSERQFKLFGLCWDAAFLADLTGGVARLFGNEILEVQHEGITTIILNIPEGKAA